MASAPQTLSALLKRATIDDHEAVLKACNLELRQSKGNLEAQHHKCVALLKLDRYDDALRVLEEGGDLLKEKAQLERAYALYKIGELVEAKTIAGAITNHRGARHIEAQASYRLEDFSDASALYKDLSNSQTAFENEENDIRINRSATDAQLEWQLNGHLVLGKKTGRQELEAFETAYNAACISIARGELNQAQFLLKTAKDLCQSLDDLSDQDKDVELLSISTQQLFVLSALGKLEEAGQLASEITLQNIPDLSTRQIAQNNKLTLASTLTNPYLSHRLFQTTSALPKTDKLFDFQANLMQQNSLALDLLISKYTGVANSTLKILSEHPSPTLSSFTNGISVLNAASHAQTQLGKLGLKEILPLLEKRPSDVGLVLTIVQLYILTNNHGSAIIVLESFLKRLDESTTAMDQDVRFAPGLVAVLVSLYTLQGRKSHIKSELAKAATYWRHKSKPSKALLQAAGLSLLDSPRPEDLKAASDIFESLHAQDPNDRFATAGYVAAHATTSPSKANAEADKLTPVKRLIAGIDIAALESAGVPHAETAKPAPTTRKRGLDDKSKPAKKRVRKSKRPADYDASKVPDLDRWLPLKERASYRPKGKKGRQKVAALTQGGVSEKGNESTAVVPSEGVVKAGGPGPASKAKKKKGKK